jgi:hypothetical protein
LAVKFKLNPDLFTSSAQKSSADSLQLQAYYLAKIIRKDKPLFRQYEQQIFDLIKIIYNYHSTQGNLSDNCFLYIDYKDIEIPMTVADRDAHNIVLYQNGLLSRAQWLMNENPDIRDKEQAENILEEIDEERLERKDLFVSGAMMQDPIRKENKNELDISEDSENIDTNAITEEPLK